MKTTIYCTPTAKGIHSFYLTFGGEDYYLFSQNYRRGVHALFANGVSLDTAMRHASAHHDEAIIHTMEKIPIYVKYVEKEYGIAVLAKTIKKQNQHNRYAALASA